MPSPTVLETERLLLRPVSADDAALILRISGDPDTVKYLYFWGRDGLTPAQDAHRYLSHALAEWQRQPDMIREYCLIRKDTGEAIGTASVEIADEQSAELGWILLPEHRGQGYATEAGRAMMDFGFTHYGKGRVIARCDTRNAPSAHVMERLGMHLTHVEKEGRAPKYEGGPRGDEATWSIDREAWAWQAYRRLTCTFDGFLPLPKLDDGEIRLVCHRKVPGNPEKNWAPAYHFLIAVGSESAGGVDLRIGYPDTLLYGGQIGYHVEEAYRGRDYAGRACRLLRPLMRLHGMQAAVITNDVNNAASRRVCEKLGCTFLCRTKLPEDNDMRLDQGMDEVNVFLFSAQE